MMTIGLPHLSRSRQSPPCWTGAQGHTKLIVLDIMSRDHFCTHLSLQSGPLLLADIVPANQERQIAHITQGRTVHDQETVRFNREAVIALFHRTVVPPFAWTIRIDTQNGRLSCKQIALHASLLLIEYPIDYLRSHVHLIRQQILKGDRCVPIKAWHNELQRLHDDYHHNHTIRVTLSACCNLLASVSAREPTPPPFPILSVCKLLIDLAQDMDACLAESGRSLSTPEYCFDSIILPRPRMCWEDERPV